MTALDCIMFAALFRIIEKQDGRTTLGPPFLLLVGFVMLLPHDFDIAAWFQ